jgi:DNA-directed RNA polymerase specialized sigma24 family protein
LDKTQEEFIKQLYIDMFYPLSAYAQSALGDKLLAEEAVQDTFRIACAKVDVLCASPNPEGWLVNTLKYVIQNTKRSRARLNSIVVTAMTYDRDVLGTCTDEIDPELIYASIVGEDNFKLLKRVALDGYSMKEAAYEQGISVETCKKRIQRTKKKIIELFEKNNK